MKSVSLKNPVFNFLLIFLIFSLLLSCILILKNLTATKPGEFKELLVQNSKRSYFLFVPTSYNPRQPISLVLGFHGRGGSARQFSQSTQLSQVAEKESFAVAYFQGTNNRWNDGREVADLPDTDDVLFVRMAIEDIKKNLNIKEKQVYATGISNGGFFTQRLACELSDQIAAFASVVSTIAVPVTQRCNPSKGVSVLLIHGSEDELVPQEGGEMTKGMGGKILSVTESAQFWQQKNKCLDAPKVELIDKVKDQTKAQISRQTQCANQKQLVFVMIEGGGHTWPGGLKQPKWRVGQTSQEINGSQFIWDFFKSNSL